MERLSTTPSGESDRLSSGDSVIPSFHKRAFSHNYHAPFIYHIILKKNDTCVAFGTLAGDARIAPGKPGSAHIVESPLGSIIAKSIYNLQRQFPILKIYQFVVMPDHVHILMRVMKWSEKHLDEYIASLVTTIAINYSIHQGHEIYHNELFMPGYCDKPLLLQRSLDALFRYIRENPHRLAMRRQYPQFFQRIRGLRIGDKEYEAYGNLFLFRNPDKEAVKISSKFTPAESARKKAAWLSAASEGTVLVSPFISRDEKAIRAEAEETGARIILITHEAFPERFKPATRDFELCEAGRLLIVSLGLPAKTVLTRSTCMKMNDLARAVSETVGNRGS